MTRDCESDMRSQDPGFRGIMDSGIIARVLKWLTSRTEPFQRSDVYFDNRDDLRKATLINWPLTMSG